MKITIIPLVLASIIMSSQVRGQEENADGKTEPATNISVAPAVAKQSPFAVTPAVINMLKNKGRERVRKDTQIYSREDLQQIEALYQTIKKSGKSEDGKKSLKLLLAKYDKANLTGCALLLIARKSNDATKIKYLQLAIEKYSDCFYADGVQVGALARLVLATAYAKKGDKSQADTLLRDIKTNYPDAINHKGESLIRLIDRKPEVGNDTILTKTFKLNPDRNKNEFSLADDHLKVSGYISESPFPNKREAGFFTVYANTFLTYLDKQECSISFGIACYDNAGTLLFADSKIPVNFKEEEGAYLSPFFCIIPLSIWKNIDHYTITILRAQPCESDIGVQLEKDI